jgi:5-deoxy-glucuronate isomerase
MKEKTVSHLLIKPQNQSSVYQYLTSEMAGWEMLNFSARRFKKGETWFHSTEANELALVILGGKCSVEASCGTWKNIGGREQVFDGMPHALYLSRHTDFILTAESESLDIAAGWCPASEDHPPRLVRPGQVSVEIRGGGNATRQINNIIPPGFDCQRLVVVEVYTPSGNWSSYPPHKHDEHRLDAAGNLLEADLEEIYFYKIDRPQGFACQRVYTADLSLDEMMIAKNDDVVLVPKGYHPVAAAFGYNVYYLNFLAGSAQSLANSDDPNHAWIKETWKEKDPRLPLVRL